MYQLTLDIIGLLGIRKPTLDFASQIRETDAMRGEVKLESVQVLCVYATRRVNENYNSQHLSAVSLRLSDRQQGLGRGIQGKDFKQERTTL